MAKPSSNSALYRLIEAGQLAHRALLVPLRDKGLEPGDDAILFVLGRSGTTEQELADELGLPWDAIEGRLNRLIERELVGRQAVGPELTPGVALTERGMRIRNSLAEHWSQLEEALMGELKPKQRKKFSGALRRFVDLLRL
ncbi:winged helix-turn-helix transcriptional regulator [Devosia sp. PTR5]|jgi:DNA-binding MarR family transcriptional regulator|uniref:Winged helix-turn-helix transcriptional regulator n=1 Tax=Devosia oryzisoli TaxID=2774138 RepID=A0A927IRN6_9HYPH|nr:MarR family winged helix-turn-helix transcriptional regulator [Devosia oryzisoli]MBD8063977.1 winged helix-turn-helix transcriptional regulator [Devosia oryzisoli]